jgi:hypothetical protein
MTTYTERFTHAVAVLCGAQPPADMVAEWIANIDVNGEHRLQSWVLSQAATPSWAQGIVVLDAAHVLANDPEEGEGHEDRPPAQPAPSQYGSPELQALVVARAIEKDRAAQPAPVQLDPKDWTPCMKLPVVVHVRQQRPGEAHVSTREGITPVKPDDLIMRGVSGEEYPIGRAIFEQTYTLDTTPPAQPAVPEGWLHQCRKKPKLKVLSFNRQEPELAAKGYVPVPLGRITAPEKGNTP